MIKTIVNEKINTFRSTSSFAKLAHYLPINTVVINICIICNKSGMNVNYKVFKVYLVPFHVFMIRDIKIKIHFTTLNNRNCLRT